MKLLGRRASLGAIPVGAAGIKEAAKTYAEAVFNPMQIAQVPSTPSAQVEDPKHRQRVAARKYMHEHRGPPGPVNLSLSIESIRSVSPQHREIMHGRDQERRAQERNTWMRSIAAMFGLEEDDVHYL